MLPKISTRVHLFALLDINLLDLVFLKKVLREKTSDLYRALKLRFDSAFKAYLERDQEIVGLTISQLSLEKYISICKTVFFAWDMVIERVPDSHKTHLVNGVPFNWDKSASKTVNRNQEITCPRWWAVNYLLKNHLKNRKGSQKRRKIDIIL